MVVTVPPLVVELTASLAPVVLMVLWWAVQDHRAAGRDAWRELQAMSRYCRDLEGQLAHYQAIDAEVVHARYHLRRHGGG